MVLNTSSINSKNLNQKKRQSIDNSMIRFPKLDECAHFHYEFTELNNFNVSLIINENYFNKHEETNLTNIRNLYLFVRVQSSNRSWTVRRNLQDFRFLDIQLHKCVFDRKHSKLKPLNLTYFSSFDSLESIIHSVSEYLERLSSIVGCFLTCGPVLHWFEIDNRGNRLISEESDINTPAIGAAFVIKKHNKSDVETEISLEIGELVSVIEMPPVNESFYWKGKKGFEVGFFPAECVQLIDDKISRKSEELTLRPLNKCVSPTLRHRSFDFNTSCQDNDECSMNIDSHNDSIMRRHGIISSLFRTFASGRIGGRRRDQLKQSGILKERVFGCDLCEHVANSGHDLPLVLTACSSFIETHGLNANGIYRLSGVASTINRLRVAFDEDRIPAELNVQTKQPTDTLDIHAVSSLLKLYFRELPNPLLTFSLYDSFVSTMRDDNLDDDSRLQAIRTLVISLPPPHWRTLRFLIRHLAYVSTFASKTGMTPKNLAIVWAPNLLRSRDLDQHVGIEALHVIGTQAVLTEFLILNCDKIFDREEHEIHPSKPLYSPFIYSKHGSKSPPISSKSLKYIDVGPEIVPGKYHTIISYRPLQSKRSKFNIQNWKKFHFFTARSHNNSNEGTYGVFQKIESDATQNASLQNSSQSTNNFGSCNYPKVEDIISNNKAVKRSQSFESYFKKLRTSKSNNVKNCTENDADVGANKSNSKMIDINRNPLEKNNFKNDTIFEVEEMFIDGPETNDKMNIEKENNSIGMNSIEKQENSLVDTPSSEDSPCLVNHSFFEDIINAYQPTNLQTITPIKSHLNESSANNVPILVSPNSSNQKCSTNSNESNNYEPPKSHSNTSSLSSITSNELVEPSSSQINLSIEPTNEPCNDNLNTQPEKAFIIELSQPKCDLLNSQDNGNSEENEPVSIVSNNSDSTTENSNISPCSDMTDACQVQELEDISKNEANSGNQSSTDSTPVHTNTAEKVEVSNNRVDKKPDNPTHSNSFRERIEKIKEERRNQIRQRLAQQMAAKGQCNNALPDIVNSSANNTTSPVRMRNKVKKDYPPKLAWRNSELTVDQSENNSASHLVTKSRYRRSVPNLEENLKISNLAQNSVNTSEELKSGHKAKVQEFSRNKNASESVRSDETSRPRPKMTITPLRTINKRQRVIDTQTLVQIFEQKSADK